MSRAVVPIRTPAPSALTDALERIEHSNREAGTLRPEIELHLALARHLVAAVDGIDLGPSPTVAQVYAWRELRITLTELGRLMIPVEEYPEPGDDPELAAIVEAIRSATRPPVDEE